MNWIKEMLLPLIIAAALFFMGAAGAAALVSAHKNAEIETLKRTHAEAEAAAAAAALERLQHAQARGDELAQQLAAAETTLQTQAEEKSHEIARLTTGRPCLSAAVVRVLNSPAPGNQPGTVPPSAGQPAAADGAAASDRDVAQWARVCRTRYDTCRVRLDALIDYHTEAAR